MPPTKRPGPLQAPPTGHADATHPTTQAATQQPGAASAPLRSSDLMQGRKLVNIEHNGHLYRLQTTKQGKLILTK